MASHPIYRRRFITGFAAALAACKASPEKQPLTFSCDPTTGLQHLEDGSHLEEPDLESNPFLLGVASGDPLHDRVIIWTRLSMELDAIDGRGGMSDEQIPVHWEVSHSEDFTDIVNSGTVAAIPELAHAVHVDVDGLEPLTSYFYRFQVGTWISPIGKTKTTPCIGQPVDGISFAVTSCQRWEDGFFTPHEHLAEENIDVVFHVGDYIYEYGEQDNVVRELTGTEIIDLASYRNRYALYRSDPALQKAHAAFPWKVVWDDHEVDNNYTIEDDNPEFIRRQAEAFQAFYEHMPIRIPIPTSHEVHLYHAFKWGSLAKFIILDTRQYRDEHACEDTEESGCPDVNDDSRTVLGTQQRQWLSEKLDEDDTTWNVIVQQIVMGNFKINGELLNYDMWDGYPPARQSIMDEVEQKSVANFLVISGDIHIGGIALLHSDVEDFDSKIIGVEVVTPSLTSNSRELESTGPLLEFGLNNLENISYVNATKRGYVVIDMNEQQSVVRYRLVDTVEVESSPIQTTAEYSILADSLKVVAT